MRFKWAKILTNRKIPISFLEGRKVDLTQTFLQEAVVMGKLDHKHLVRILCLCAGKMMLVTQLMPLGSLLDYVSVAAVYVDQSINDHFKSWLDNGQWKYNNSFRYGSTNLTSCSGTEAQILDKVPTLVDVRTTDSQGYGLSGGEQCCTQGSGC